MKPLLMTALKNRLNQYGSYEFHLRNINVNGCKRGCSGHVLNPANGKCVYVDTEDACGGGYAPLAGKVMYREAKSIKDFSGGINQWVKRDDAPAAIAAMLEG